MSEWQPIDTAPKDGTNILLWNPAFNTPDIGHFFEGVWITPDDYFDIDFPLGGPFLWHPLPFPPKEVYQVGELLDQKEVPKENRMYWNPASNEVEVIEYTSDTLPSKSEH